MEIFNVPEVLKFHLYRSLMKWKEVMNTTSLNVKKNERKKEGKKRKN